MRIARGLVLGTIGTGLSLAVVAAVVLADGGAAHQADQLASGSTIVLGCTGGNVRDISRFFCCSGTLGCRVTDGSTKYILSNSHVLALSGKGSVGDDISHPGMIDAGCTVKHVVADLSAWHLGGQVDGAIAAIRTNVDPSGSILDIGIP